MPFCASVAPWNLPLGVFEEINRVNCVNPESKAWAMGSITEMLAVTAMAVVMAVGVLIRLCKKLAHRMIRGTVITLPVEQIHRGKEGCEVTFIIYFLFNTVFNK